MYPFAGQNTKCFVSSELYPTIATVWVLARNQKGQSHSFSYASQIRFSVCHSSPCILHSFDPATSPWFHFTYLLSLHTFSFFYLFHTQLCALCCLLPTLGKIPIFLSAYSGPCSFPLNPSLKLITNRNISCCLLTSNSPSPPVASQD